MFYFVYEVYKIFFKLYFCFCYGFSPCIKLSSRGRVAPCSSIIADNYFPASQNFCCLLAPVLR